MVNFLSIASRDINIGFEAIPPNYNTNFCNNYLQVQNLVDLINSDNLNIHFDTGCATDYGIIKSINSVNKTKIRNIHLSKPNLASLDGTENFIDILSKNGLLRNRFVSIEMRKTPISNIKTSLKVFEGS